MEKQKDDMIATIARLANTPVDLKGSDGKTYQFSMIGTGDLPRLEDALKDIVVDQTREDIKRFGEDIDAEQKKAIWNDSIKRVRNISLIDMTGDPRAFRVLFRLGVKQHHKDLTDEQLEDLASTENVLKVKERLDEIERLTEEAAQQNPIITPTEGSPAKIG